MILCMNTAWKKSESVVITAHTFNRKLPTYVCTYNTYVCYKIAMYVYMCMSIQQLKNGTRMVHLYVCIYSYVYTKEEYTDKLDS